MSLTAIVTQILKHAQALDAYIEAEGLPQPSFDKMAPFNFPIPATPKTLELQQARAAIFEATRELQELAAGPT